MTLRSRSVRGPVFAALLVAAGCGKDDKETARFNESIGGRGPITVAGIDPGLLQDPSAYKPASGGGGGLGTGGGGSEGGGASSGGEADAAKRAVTSVFESVTTLSAASILDSFSPSEVQALSEVDFTTSLQTVFDALSQLTKTLQTKVGDAEKSVMDALPGQFTKAVGDAIEVTIVDPETATATLDAAKIQNSMQAWGMEMAAKAGAGAPNPSGGAAPPAERPGRVAPPEGTSTTPDGASGTTPPAPGGDAFAGLLANASAGGGVSPAKIPLKKIDGKWRIQLPKAVGKELAGVLKEGCEITHELLSQLNARLDTVPANDQPAMQGAFMSMLPIAMGQYAGWFQRLQEAMGEDVGAGEKRPAEGTKKEETSASPGVINP